MTPEEEQMLANSEACSSCGHLSVLHNYHCCEFCTVDGCRCEWGKVRDPNEPVKDFYETMREFLAATPPIIRFPGTPDIGDLGPLVNMASRDIAPTYQWVEDDLWKKSDGE